MSRDDNAPVRLTDRRLDARVDEPLHLHLRAEESLLVLDGTVLVSVGGRRSVLTAGEATTIPAGAIHALVPVRGDAAVLMAHRAAVLVDPVDVPTDSWPVMDGLGTLLLGPDPTTSPGQPATRPLRADRG